MKYINTILIVIVIILVGGLYLNSQNNLGSVEPLGGYDYAQYTSGLATNTAIFVGPGIFGSVIVNEDPAGAIVYYDATSTAALSGATTLFTEIATLEAAQAEGTYTYDVNVSKGLVQAAATADVDFAGDITVTYRQGY